MVSALPRGRCYRDALTAVRPAAVALSGMERALAALYSAEPGPTGDDAIAECEQRRREFMSKQQAQAELLLPCMVSK